MALPRCYCQEVSPRFSAFTIFLREKLVQGVFCNAKAKSERAEVLRSASVIICDKIPMASELAPEALGLTLSDCQKCKRPFGGATLAMNGASRFFWNS